MISGSAWLYNKWKQCTSRNVWELGTTPQWSAVVCLSQKSQGKGCRPFTAALRLPSFCHTALSPLTSTPVKLFCGWPNAPKLSPEHFAICIIWPLAEAASVALYKVVCFRHTSTLRNARSKQWQPWLAACALAFLAVFVYATHATQAIAFQWKPCFTQVDSVFYRPRVDNQLVGWDITNYNGGCRR